MGGLLVGRSAGSAAQISPAATSVAAQPKVRPRFIWDNREDEIYHELNAIKDEFTANDPCYYAFYNKSWTFNRSMKWLRANGTVIAYDAAGDLMLTGMGQQSSWFSGPENSLADEHAFTRFTKKSAGRKIDCAVLPMFQYHLGQHPVMELNVSEAGADWQFCIGLKGRAGPPLICSGWQRGAKTLRFDVAQVLRNLGYEKNYTEVHFIIGTWNDDPQAHATLKFSLKGVAQPAVVACLPVIRTAKSATRGVSITALLADGAGQRVGNIAPVASIGGMSLPMQAQDGLWSVVLNDLPVGEHHVTIAAPGFAPSSQYVRITDGVFFQFDREKHFAHKAGQRLEPLGGSYQGSFLVRDAGLKSERLITGHDDWQGWDHENGAAERAHGWESLTPAELDRYFAYLARCGWDLLHLHQYWGIWERLDAFGNIAPHGAEQLAQYMRAASKHGLACIQALSSYPYSTRHDQLQKWGTIPWKQTLDAGFSDDDWFNPKAGAFQSAFHAYLNDFVTLFREETALFAMSASGEGDHTNGLPRSNDVFHFVRDLDSNHIFYAEAVFFPGKKLYDAEIAGWTQDYYGGRTYSFGEFASSELDLGVFFKFCRMGDNIVMAEGAWPPTNVYTHFLNGRGRRNNGEIVPYDSWIGTPEYATHLRDSVYLGFTTRLAMIVTWDEKLFEDERVIFKQARSLVNWDQKFRRPSVGLLGHDDNIQGAKRKVYTDYEKAFRKLGIDYSILSDRMRPFPTGMVVYDTAAFEAPAYQSAGGRLPDQLKAAIPVAASTGYFVDYALSVDGATLLAYFYNVSGHREKAYFISPTFHRTPRETPFEFHLTYAPAGGSFHFYDLNEKSLLRQGPARGFTGLDLPMTRHDFLLVVVP